MVKENVWLVDVDWLINRGSGLAESLVSSLAAEGRVAYVSLLDPLMWDEVDHWLHVHHYPEGGLFVGSPDDARGRLYRQCEISDVLADVRKAYDITGILTDDPSGQWRAAGLTVLTIGG